MTKFRKKPVVIEAEQFDASAMKDEWPKGVYATKASDTGYMITTLEGPFQVKDGDWIITGIKGEKYPCKPDIFEETYESVAETVCPQI